MQLIFDVFYRTISLCMYHCIVQSFQGHLTVHSALNTRQSFLNSPHRSLGMYLARSLSFKEVEYEILRVKTSPLFTALWDTAAALWRRVDLTAKALLTVWGTMRTLEAAVPQIDHSDLTLPTQRGSKGRQEPTHEARGRIRAAFRQMAAAHSGPDGSPPPAWVTEFLYVFELALTRHNTVAPSGARQGRGRAPLVRECKAQLVLTKTYAGQRWSSQQRFAGNMVLAAKVPALVRIARRKLATGFDVIITLQSTGEAYMEKGGAGGGSGGGGRGRKEKTTVVAHGSAGAGSSFSSSALRRDAAGRYNDVDDSSSSGGSDNDGSVGGAGATAKSRSNKNEPVPDPTAGMGPAARAAVQRGAASFSGTRPVGTGSGSGRLASVPSSTIAASSSSSASGAVPSAAMKRDPGAGPRLASSAAYSLSSSSSTSAMKRDPGISSSCVSAMKRDPGVSSSCVSAMKRDPGVSSSSSSAMKRDPGAIPPLPSKSTSSGSGSGNNSRQPVFTAPAPSAAADDDGIDEDDELDPVAAAADAALAAEEEALAAAEAAAAAGGGSAASGTAPQGESVSAPKEVLVGFIVRWVPLPPIPLCLLDSYGLLELLAPPDRIDEYRHHRRINGYPQGGLAPPEAAAQMAYISALIEWGALIRAAEALPLPPNPLDDLTDRLGGPGKVAEVSACPYSTAAMFGKTMILMLQCRRTYSPHSAQMLLMPPLFFSIRSSLSLPQMSGRTVRMVRTDVTDTARPPPRWRRQRVDRVNPATGQAEISLSSDEEDTVDDSADVTCRGGSGSGGARKSASSSAAAMAVDDDDVGATAPHRGRSSATGYDAEEDLGFDSSPSSSSSAAAAKGSMDVQLPPLEKPLVLEAFPASQLPPYVPPSSAASAAINQRRPSSAAAPPPQQPSQPENDCVSDAEYYARLARDRATNSGGGSNNNAAAAAGNGGRGIALADHLAAHNAGVPTSSLRPDTLLVPLPIDTRRWRVVKRLADGVGNDLGRDVEISKNSSASASSEMVNLKEREAFQRGVKRIALLTAASSSGISLHDCGGASRRRAHLLPQMPWSSDQLVQAAGRSHRSGQKTAPLYSLIGALQLSQCWSVCRSVSSCLRCFVGRPTLFFISLCLSSPAVTDVFAENRFASAVAARLASLGALTRGDRRTASAIDMSSFNIEGKVRD